MKSHDNTKTKTAKNKTLAANSVILQLHIPVLSDEVFSVLQPKEGGRYLDLTAGYGGHASVMSSVVREENMKLIDRDINAVKVLKNRFKTSEIVHSDFVSILREMVSNRESFDYILADIGVSSPHLDNPDRGFSFMSNGPLDMRMDQSSGKTAAEVIEQLSVDELSDIFRKYGEERQASRLATAIKQDLPKTTIDLADLVERVKGRGKRGKKHPATQVFQALRIHVNDELGQLNELLELAPRLLNSGGTLAVISFHSLEDRMIKTVFKEMTADRYDTEYELVNKKVIQPSENEIVSNPRARSSKLRALRKK